MFGGGWGSGYAPPPTDAVLNSISQEFDYNDLCEATGRFSSANRLGEGTYGTVFRGTLRDGTEVAVKQLSSPKEGGFREEVEVLSKFRHPNLVILLGFARNRKERYLVYEFLSGGDVHARLEKDREFNWEKRINVGLDCALGLSHLHGSRPQVFHRDVKSQNILMDRNGTGKVADFGLACLAQPNQKSMRVGETSGTIGYADPNYIRSGIVTEKSEVYSFGMVMMELLTGRPPALQHPSGRIDYQFEHVRGDIKKVYAMVDRRANFPPKMVDLMGGLALRSINEQESLRPSFVDIVTQFRGWLRDKSLHAGGASPISSYPSQNYSSSAWQRGGQGMDGRASYQAAGAAGRDRETRASDAFAGHSRASGGGGGQQASNASQQQRPSVQQRGADGGHAPQQLSAGGGAQSRGVAAAGRDWKSGISEASDSRSRHQPAQQNGRGPVGRDDRRLLGVIGGDSSSSSGVADPRRVQQDASRRAANPLEPAARAGYPDARREGPSIRQGGVGEASRSVPAGGHAASASREPAAAAYREPQARAREERAPAPAREEAKAPQTGSANVVQQLLQLGISQDNAAEAAKRCSSVEAAMEWLIANDKV